MYKSFRIHSYTFREILGPAILGLTIYSFMLLMNEIFLIAERTLSQNLPLTTALKLFALAIPSVLVLTIPMATLLAVLVGIGRLSADQEWTALQAAGHGPRILATPLIALGLTASIISFGIFNYVVPTTQQRAREQNAEIMLAGNLGADLRPRQWEVIGDINMIVDEIRPGNNDRGSLEDLVVIRNEKDRVSITLAGSGDIFPTPSADGTLIVDLYDSIRHDFDEVEVDNYRIATWDAYRESIPLPAHLRSFLEPQAPTVRAMQPPDLLVELGQAAQQRTVANERASELKRERISEQVIADSRHNRVIVELNRRIALPLACLFFAVLALPLGVSRVRSGKGAGFALSLLVIIVYWVAFTFFENLSLRQRFPAALGPWMGNLILVPWIALAYYRMGRPERSKVGLLGKLFRLTVRALRALRARLPFAPPVPDEATNGPEQALADLAGTSRRFVRRTDRYVAMQFIRILGLTMASAYTLFLLIEVKNSLEELFKRQQPISLMFDYLGYVSLERFPLVLPLACLAASVIAFSILTRSGELTAMKANGISLRRATLPVLVITAALSGLLFMLSNTVIPTATRKGQETSDLIRGKQPATKGLPATGNWTYGPNGEKLYYYRYYDEQRDEFHDLRILSLDDSRDYITDHRFAPLARFRDDRGWELDGGWFLSFKNNGSEVGTQETFKTSYEVELDSPQTFAPQTGRSLTRRKTDYASILTLSEIDSRIKDLDARGYDVTSLRVAWHGKFAWAVTPFVMSLLALPFAFRLGRRGSLYGVGISFILGIAYWVVFAAFNALGLETILEPILAVWAPHVLFSLLGAYLLLYVPT
jgi:LPS export ABC transporter permease LptG